MDLLGKDLQEREYLLVDQLQDHITRTVVVLDTQRQVENQIVLQQQPLLLPDRDVFVSRTGEVFQMMVGVRELNILAWRVK